MAGRAALPTTAGHPEDCSKRQFKRVRHYVRNAVASALLCALLGFVPCQSALADPIRGEATLSSPDGNYARLLFKFSEDVPTEAVMAGSILVVKFAKPVDINADALVDVLPTYVGSVRRDPDGTAIRFALMQQVKVNLMTAGDRVFVDLLPERWSGLPPPLPAEVVKELSDRALAAERALRLKKQAEEGKKRPPVRVRTAVQPTFVRFVFELPDGVSVSSSLNADKYTLSFSSALTFDLADAKITAPSNIKDITQSMTGDSVSVEIALIGEVDVHGFRDERNYIVDIGFDARKQTFPPPGTIPLQPAVTPKSESNAAPAAPAKVSEEKANKANDNKDVERDVAKAVAKDIAKDAAKARPAETLKATTEPSQASAPQTEVPQQQPSQQKSENPAPAPLIVPAKDEVKKDEAKESVTAQPEPAKPEEAKPVASNAAPTNPAASSGGDSIVVSAKRMSDNFRITFPFQTIPPVALFRHADAVWLIVADKHPLKLDAIAAEGGPLVSNVDAQQIPGGQAIRIRLTRQQLPSLEGDDHALVLVLSEKEVTGSQPLVVTRNVADPSHANITIPFSGSGPVLRISDPDVGDSLFVVTGRLPARGLLRRQNFVEFSLFESTHGIVVQPNSEDVTVNTTPEQAVISRPNGLTLSPVSMVPERGATTGVLFDVGEWNANQTALFLPRLDKLTRDASLATGEEKIAAQLALAKFYIARGFYAEAKGILDFALSKPSTSALIPTVWMTKAIAESLGGYSTQALKDFQEPAIGGNFDTQLWKALASARLGKWPDAREQFKNVEFSIIALPIDLQRILLLYSMRASVETGDYAAAAVRNNDLMTIGTTPSQAARLSFLQGKLAEGLGREKDALSNYHKATVSDDRPAAAEGLLAEIALRQKRNEISDDDALHDLESLQVNWRGDNIEVKSLQMLSRLYTDKKRYADALAASITATKIDPNSDAARAVQDDAAALFSQIFLSDKGEGIPPIKALGLFYQYRELTPIGRRGDELIRRLADRLVAVDLLDQAADLLQYQVDKRLEGAARAQVAVRLATIYLMNRKPDRAIAALRSTRIADLAGELRQQRLLLEARAQSDIGRHDLALDIISNLSGREVIRLRSDIYWAARRWRESSEQIEVLYGQRWQDFQPLTPTEKSDIIRAAVGYALANDSLGLSRFREKYGPKMETEADRSAFAIASKPVSGSTADLERVAKMAATIDTLDGFLREMKARFPDAFTSARAPTPATGDSADTTGSLPQIIGVATAR